MGLLKPDQGLHALPGKRDLQTAVSRKSFCYSEGMKLDLPQPEIWERLNDAVKQELSLESDHSARVFANLSAAVFEIAQGTAQFMSHKKSVAWVKGQTPAFEFLLPHFYKEAYEVQPVAHLDLAKPEFMKEWVSSLKRDTVFVLYAEDHPVTGEVYSFVDEFDRLLSEKRIPSFRISHRRHFTESLPVRPYSVRICAWADDLAIAICGDRFRSPALVAPSQHWSRQDVLSRLQAARAGFKENSIVVQEFEKQMSGSAKPWFSASAARVWDRAALVFAGVSGEALVSVIAQKLNLPAGENSPLDTTNLCHRSAVRPYQGWWEPFPGEDALSGLVLFSADILAAKDFAKIVLSSYEEVKSLQSWTV